MSPKVYTLEHTKPLFKELNILSVEYLYKYHTFMELFKIMKHQSPVSLYCLFKPNSLYHRNISIILPSPRLEKSKTILYLNHQQFGMNLYKRYILMYI